MHSLNESHVVTPINLEELISALQKAKKEHGPKLMYRGQRNAARDITSAFSRGFTDSTLKLIRDPSTRQGEKAYFIAIMSFMNYFSSIKPTEELIQKLNGKGCPYFEYARHHQQNYLKSKIHDIEKMNLLGAPIIDFTYDELVALFFANFEINFETQGLQPEFKSPRSTNGAIYVINYDYLEMYESFLKIFISYQLGNIENREFKKPCIIHPLFQINDTDDMKPKKQKAAYVVHIDSRYSIDESLSIIETSIGKKIYSKIIVPKEIFEDCKVFLFDRNYTLNYLFPPEIQYQAQVIQKTFQTLINIDKTVTE